MRFPKSLLAKEIPFELKIFQIPDKSEKAC
jgi:hypothetical protein